MIKNTLLNVRLLTEFDPYSIDADNRPLLDLIGNIELLADVIDSRTGKMVLDQDGIILAAQGCLESSNCIKTVTGVYPISVNALNTNYGVSIGVESATPLIVTYSNKTALGFDVNVFDLTGTAVDAPITVKVDL